MAADRRLALHATLPERYAGLEILASNIDHRGRLAALVADPAQDFFSAPRPSVLRPPPCYNATVLICDGVEVREVPLNDLDLWFTHIDTLAEDIVLAAARCGPDGVPRERRWKPVPGDEVQLPANVRVIDGDGRTRAAFYAGDGIAQLMTDARRNIWISYFDESNYWFPNPDGTRSLRLEVGLARWGDDGGSPWFVWDDTPGVVWCDCYALNVGDALVYACPYTDFPMVTIDANGVRDVTPNTVEGCTGLAVSSSEFAFLNQRRARGGFCWEIRTARKEDGTVVETGHEYLVLPEGRQPKSWARGRTGRDGTLWLQEDGDPARWYRYEIGSTNLREPRSRSDPAR